MQNIHEHLSQIEHQLTQAEQALASDDGRCWPPPPAPPKRRCDWAKDNSAAVDPHDYESCKAYVFTNLMLRPLLEPGMFPRSLADLLASTVCSDADAWVQPSWKLRYILRDGKESPLILGECRDLYGMAIQV